MARSLFIALFAILFNLFAPLALADDSSPPAEEEKEEEKKEPEVILAPAPPPKPTKAKKKKKAKEVEVAPVEEAPSADPTVEVALDHEPVVTLADPADANLLAPVDGGPRSRSIFTPRFALPSNYIDFRLGYQYQAWLKPSWALVLPTQFQVVAGTMHANVQDLRGSVEVGVQHTTFGQVGTLHQQLRLGVWADAFPAQASPSATYSFDGEVGHRILDLDGLVSWRPLLTTEDQLVSEGSAGLWMFREGAFRLAGAWDTELGVGPRIDFNVKTVRFNTTVFLGGGDLALAAGATWRM